MTHEGLHLHGGSIRFCGPFVGTDQALRLGQRRWAMSATEVITLGVAGGLLLYLTFALLKPEWFA
jgi:hypothetical protein